MTPFVFGYGSLVNRRTLDGAEAHPARLEGWRRMWRHTDLRPVAFLTAVPDPESAIDGLIVEVGGGDWRALDEREAAYLRVPAERIAHRFSGPADVQVYHVPDGLHAPATETHPVLLSYIDTVVQGFLAEFGEEGVARFFETTDGWDAPVRDDRAAPVYRRAQSLTGAERGLVDAHLSEHSVRVIPAA